MTVFGNELSITDGDNASNSNAHTDYGAVVRNSSPITRTFAVRNDGGGVLNLSGLSASSGFTLTRNFGQTTLHPGESTSFAIAMLTSVGNKSGVVSFNTDDTDEAQFSFAVEGVVRSGLAPIFKKAKYGKFSNATGRSPIKQVIANIRNLNLLTWNTNFDVYLAARPVDATGGSLDIPLSSVTMRGKKATIKAGKGKKAKFKNVVTDALPSGEYVLVIRTDPFRLGFRGSETFNAAVGSNYRVT